MSESWGPWIEHDGSGQPVSTGTIVQVEYYTGSQPIFASEDGPWWNGGGYRRWKGGRANWVPILRYRIRKPKGLQLLQDILREVEDDGGMGYNEREMEEVK